MTFSTTAKLGLEVPDPGTGEQFSTTKVVGWINSLDAHAGPVVCTSGTRPTTNLFAGYQIFESDTKLLYVYTGSAWSPVVPTFGVVGSCKLTTGFSTLSDFDYVELFTAPTVTGRRYIFNVNTTFRLSATASWRIVLRVNNTYISRLGEFSADGFLSAHCIYDAETTSTKNIRLSVSLASGTGTCGFVATTATDILVNPIHAWLTDVGVTP